MELSGFEASVLALIAQNPQMPSERLNGLLEKVSPNAREIAVAIVSLAQEIEPDSATGPVAEAAKAALDWARSNRDYVRSRTTGRAEAEAT